MTETSPKLHYVLSTHWDREWYLPFQEYRHMLVGLLDEVLDAIARGELRGPFTCDGQSILLEDYLEIRPERKGEVLKNVAAGHLVLGPWYVLPDEFLVSGESLIRNLRLGREMVRALGGVPSDAGFLCDLFGHNSQMPQIFAGFGIKGALVWRGVDARVGAHLRWEGADGTVIPAFRFGRRGYCDYTYKVRRSNEHATDFDPARARADLLAYLEEEIARSGAGRPALIFDGGDHLYPDWEHYQMLCRLISETGERWHLDHSTLDRFLEDSAGHANGDNLPLLSGELREPARWPVAEDTMFLIPGCTASRVWIKLENAACESLLCGWAEPFGAFAHFALGTPHADGFLRVAWKWLLQNHPHDSICGCSVDQVHEDMRFRFSQCRQIAERIASESLHALAAAIPGELGNSERRLVLFNPLARAREDEAIEFDVEIPAHWPEFTEFFGYEPKPAFRLFDEETGCEIPYQLLQTQRAKTRMKLSTLKYPRTYVAHVVRVAARVTIPPFGYTSFRVRGQPGNGSSGDHLGNRGVPPTRHPSAKGLRSGATTMENAFLAVTLSPEGTISILHKTTGREYRGLNAFESDADIGDGWYHGPPVNRFDVVAGAAAVHIDLLADTPLLTRFRIRRSIHIPRRFESRLQSRCPETVELNIESEVTLRDGSGWVDVETRVANTAEDHRLRALFPSGVVAKTYLADTPFDVVERPVALRADNHLYRELEVETRPQQSWTAVFEQGAGLALVTGGGLLETAVLDRADRPIALTLFRATGRTKNTNGEPLGQLIGLPLTFRYRLVPLSGAPDRTALFLHVQDLACGVRGIHLDASDLEPRPQQPLAPRDGFLSCEGSAVVTSIRKVESALEVRAFNPAPHPVPFRIAMSAGLEARQMECVDFESRPLQTEGSDAASDSRLRLGLKKIITLRTKPEPTKQ